MQESTLQRVKAWSTAFVIVSIAVVCLTLVGKFIEADGKVTQCYVEGSVNSDTGKVEYRVIGYVPWRLNRVLAISDGTEQASDALQRVCPNR